MTKAITIYCAHCMRPLARQFEGHRLKERTEACIRERVARRETWPNGDAYWLIDGSCEVQCSAVTISGRVNWLMILRGLHEAWGKRAALESSSR